MQGGATTSPAHTAVKIDPEYEQAVAYVKDASRAVGVCQSLITAEGRAGITSMLKADHAVRRRQFAGAGRADRARALRAGRRDVDLGGVTVKMATLHNEDDVALAQDSIQ